MHTQVDRASVRNKHIINIENDDNFIFFQVWINERQWESKTIDFIWGLKF